MVRRRRGPVTGGQAPTVWADWSPGGEGPCLVSLRRYLERMDEVRAGIAAKPDELAQLMLDVYLSASRERFAEATGSAG